MDWITTIFGAVKEFFGFAKQHEALQNSPEMQANKVAKNDQARVEQIAKEEDAAASGNLDPLQKDIAE